MPLYTSFLVRCWLLRDQPQGGRAVFDVEHIQTGEHARVYGLTEACEWMKACQLAQLKAVAPRDEAPGPRGET